MAHWNIWSEGFVAWPNMRVSAQLYFRDIKGNTFKEACETVLDGCTVYDAQKNTLWGCQLFDNENDARKHFG